MLLSKSIHHSQILTNKTILSLNKNILQPNRMFVELCNLKFLEFLPIILADLKIVRSTGGILCQKRKILTGSGVIINLMSIRIIW